MELFESRRASLISSTFLQLHGVERFHAEDTHKRADIENRLLQNRIIKLLKEEENARKKSEYSQKRTEELLKQKEHHLQTIQEKHNNKAKKQEELEKKRQEINDAKQQRKRRMQMISQTILLSKQDIGSTVRKDRNLNDSLYKQYLDMVQLKNSEKANKHKESKEKMVSDRSKSQLMSKSTLKEQYLKAIENHKNEYLKALQQKSELVKLEEELLQRFSNSKNAFLQKFSSIANLSHVRSSSTNEVY